MEGRKKMPFINPADRPAEENTASNDVNQDATETVRTEETEKQNNAAPASVAEGEPASAPSAPQAKQPEPRVAVKEDRDESSAFAAGLPPWSLEPPAVPIRRKRSI